MPTRGSRKGHLNINGKLINKGQNYCLKILTFRDCLLYTSDAADEV